MAGRQLGNYRVIDYLGGGGFGSVFKAEDVNVPGRMVAVKELHRKHTRSASIKQRFFQEALAMAKLDHPNLPRLFTFGEDQGSYYLVMEFLSGRLLSDEINEKGPLDRALAAAIMAQVLQALSYAHRNGVIHRDLKPDNIMLQEDQVKVLDFGIARMVGGENITMAGEGFGTPAYMSPERIKGGTDIDQRTDIYSAGIVLYEMLAGRLPFDSKSTDPMTYWTEMRRFHESESLPSLAVVGVPAELERVVLKATAKKVEDRYPTADDMLADLSRLSDARISAALTAKPASLMLAIKPSPAEVFVDNLLRGTSDRATGKILIEGLAAGLHEIRVSKGGYNEYRISLSLEEGRRTDLQVALAARATVPVPVDNTSPMDPGTVRMGGADEAATALLEVAGLPAGATILVDSKEVARADDDGRATLMLDPGPHELSANTPTGVEIKQTVNVTANDNQSPNSMTFPFSQMTVPKPAATEPTPAMEQKTVSLGSEPSPRGKAIAAAAAVLLLVALAAAAYVLMRKPEQAMTSSNQAPAAEELAKTQSQLMEVQKQLAELKSKEQGLSDAEKERLMRLEAEQKKLESQKGGGEKPAEELTKADTAEALAQVPAPPQTPASQAPPDAQASGVSDPNTCVAVYVTGPDGRPAQGMRIVCAKSSGDGAPQISSGQTGPRGRWQGCGLVPGSPVKILVFSGRALLETRSLVLSAGQNYIEIQVASTPRKERVTEPEEQASEPAPPGGPFRPRRNLRRKP
jgi:hypothetical protein